MIFHVSVESRRQLWTTCTTVFSFKSHIRSIDLTWGAGVGMTVKKIYCRLVHHALIVTPICVTETSISERRLNYMDTISVVTHVG